MTIGLTAVLNFANDEAWKKKISEEVFSGKKKICLVCSNYYILGGSVQEYLNSSARMLTRLVQAITEAFAGSDVAGLRTTAVKTPDGKHYIVNGTKKWITNVCRSPFINII